MPKTSANIRISVVAVLLSVVACSCSAGRSSALIESEAKATLVTNRAPEIVGLDYLGEVAVPLRGTITLINFWGWWCPPCMDEMPLLQSFHDKHRGGGRIQLVGITGLRSGADETEERRRIDKAIADHGMTFPITISGQSCRDYKIQRWPTTILVDQSGDIVDYAIGEDGTRRLMALAEGLADPLVGR